MAKLMSNCSSGHDQRIGIGGRVSAYDKGSRTRDMGLSEVIL